MAETVSNVTNKTHASVITLQQLNDEEFYRRLPPVIYLSVLMAIGLPGNLLVFIIYYRKFKISTHRTFILMLAVVDFGVCAITLPFEIIEMRYQYTFYVVSVCKVFRANNNFLSIGSVLIVCCMSLDRYRRICYPLKRQMSPRVCKLFCIGVMAAALVLSSPNFVLSGIRTVALKNNITGSDCSFSDKYVKTIFPLVYGGSLFLLFVLCLIALIVVYSFIARKIYKFSKFRRSFDSTVNSTSTNTQTSSSSQSNPVEKKSEIETDSQHAVPEPEERMMTSENRNKNNSSFDRKKVDTTNKQWSTRNNGQSVGRVTHRSIKGRDKDKRRTAKVTKVTFMISLVLILSYLPNLTLTLVTAVKGEFVAEPGPVVSAVLPIVSRSFAINNVANPIIYGFFDPRFRNICRNGIKTVFRQ